jgi:phage tail-like protein
VPETHGQLVVQSQGKVLRTVPLSPGRCTIGSTPDNTVVLASPLVSPRHAELEVTAAGALLTDLGSSIGTVAGGTPLVPNQPTPIPDGTMIQIGIFIIVYTAPETAARPDPGAAPPDPVAAPVEAPPLERRPPPPEPPPRRLDPLRDAAGVRSFYLEMLPALFQDQDFLGRYLMIPQTFWEPLEWRQDFIELYFDPRTAPERMLPFLARWLGVPDPEPRREGHLRRFLTTAMLLYSWRGTSYGLRQMILVCAGLEVDITEDGPYTFEVRVSAADVERRAKEETDGRPLRARVEGLRRYVEDLIQEHKPAHAAYTLEFT